jgi:alpha-L-fucosidase
MSQQAFSRGSATRSRGHQRQRLLVLLFTALSGALVFVSAQTADPQTRLLAEDRIARESWMPKVQATRADRVTWWREGRFGMFIHWGVYSGLAGEWKGEPVKGYAEHIMRIKRIPRQVYLDEVVHAFNPTAFDANAWASLAKRAGMKYLVITSKHHDGFAMFDSQVSPYNIVQATPFKRDPMKELREACAKQGIKFGFYYSHAWDWENPDAPGNDWDYDNPGGDKQLHGGARWFDQDPEFVARDEKYVATKAIPQVKELIAKYHPDILWFDTPSKQPPFLNLRVLNAVRQVDPKVIVNSRIITGADPKLAGPYNYGDYLSTADRPAEFRPVEGDWEGIPTTNESYGYHKSDRSHKPSSHFIRLLAKAAAKGGNLMLNIGPMGDGRVDPADVAILEGIGTWLTANGESIYGTSRSPLPVQAWGAITAARAPQTGGTPQRLYLHVFDWPSASGSTDDHALLVAGLQSNIRKAYLLGDKQQKPLAVKRVNADDLAITLPNAAPDPIDTVIIAELDGPAKAEPSLLVRARGETLLHVFDGTLAGDGARYDDGKANRDCVTEWKGSGATVSWNVRVTEPVRLTVAADYAASEKHGGTYVVKVDDQQFEAKVERTGADQQFARREVATVTLQPGHHTVTVTPTKIDGELMRLRGLRWTPAPQPTAAP